MIRFEQQFTVAGALCERNEFAGALARQRRLAAKVGVEPQPPLGLVRRCTIAQLLADLVGAPIDRFNLGALHAPHDIERRTELQKEVQLTCAARRLIPAKRPPI